MAEERAAARRALGALHGLEVWWRDHQVWLQERGYMLRKRFRPGWTPSWWATDDYPNLHEDGQISQVSCVLHSFTGDTHIFRRLISPSWMQSASQMANLSF
jgi:hypothetical protein